MIDAYKAMAKKTVFVIGIVTILRLVLGNLHNHQHDSLHHQQSETHDEQIQQILSVTSETKLTDEERRVQFFESQRLLADAAHVAEQSSNSKNKAGPDGEKKPKSKGSARKTHKKHRKGKASHDNDPERPPRWDIGAPKSASQWAIVYYPYNSDATCKSLILVRSDIAAIARHGFTTIRLHAIDCDALAKVGTAAKLHGLRLILGINVGLTDAAASGVAKDLDWNAEEPDSESEAESVGLWEGTNAWEDAVSQVDEIIDWVLQGFDTEEVEQTKQQGRKGVEQNNHGSGKLSHGIRRGEKHAEKQSVLQQAHSEWSIIELILVGEETILNDIAPPPHLANLITYTRKRLREVGYTGPVSTSEPIATLHTHRGILCPVIDIPASNIHPFFNVDVRPDHAGEYVSSGLKALEEVCDGFGWPSLDGQRVEGVHVSKNIAERNAGGGRYSADDAEDEAHVSKLARRQVICTETGWPSRGRLNGLARPGKTEQRMALMGLGPSDEKADLEEKVRAKAREIKAAKALPSTQVSESSQDQQAIESTPPTPKSHHRKKSKGILPREGHRSVLIGWQDDQWKDGGVFGVEDAWGCEWLFGDEGQRAGQLVEQDDGIDGVEVNWKHDM